jgi:hypothetical protein
MRRDKQYSSVGNCFDEIICGGQCPNTAGACHSSTNFILFVLHHISCCMLFWSSLGGLTDERPMANIHPSGLCPKRVKLQHEYLDSLSMARAIRDAEEEIMSNYHTIHLYTTQGILFVSRSSRTALLFLCAENRPTHITGHQLYINDI